MGNFDFKAKGFKSMYDYTKFRKYIQVTGKEITVEEYYSNQKEYDKVYNEYYRQRYQDPEYKENMKEYQKQRSQNPKVREKIKGYSKKYYQNPEFREKKKEYGKQRWQKQKEIRNQQDAQLLEGLTD